MIRSRQSLHMRSAAMLDVSVGLQREPHSQSFLLRRVQPALSGLMDGSLSTLAPIFAVVLATHRPLTTFYAGAATALGAGVSMAFSEGLSDTGDLTGRGNGRFEDRTEQSGNAGRLPGGFASRGGIPASRNAAAAHPCHHDRMPLRCLLVDDNDAFLEAASVLLRREGVTVVGLASNTAEALRLARALRPDVFLVDIGLGNESGFELARLLARDGQRGRAEVVMMSARAETDYAELIAESPAAGFLQ